MTTDDETASALASASSIEGSTIVHNDINNDDRTNGLNNNHLFFNCDTVDHISVQPAVGYSAPSYTIPSLGDWNPFLRARAYKLINQRRKLESTYTEPLILPAATTTTSSSSSSTTTNITSDLDGNGSTIDGTGTDTPCTSSSSSTSTTDVINYSSEAKQMRKFFKDFHGTIYKAERREYYKRIRQRYPEVDRYYSSLVTNDATMIPIVTYEDFWLRYEWRVGSGSIERVMKELQVEARNKKHTETLKRQKEENDHSRQERERNSADAFAAKTYPKFEQRQQQQGGQAHIFPQNATQYRRKKKDKDTNFEGRDVATESDEFDIRTFLQRDHEKIRQDAEKFQKVLTKVAQNFNAVTAALTSDDNVKRGIATLATKAETIANETIQNNMNDNVSTSTADRSSDSGGPATPRFSNDMDYQYHQQYHRKETPKQKTRMYSSVLSAMLVVLAATAVLWLGPILTFVQSPIQIGHAGLNAFASVSYNMLCGPVRPGWYIDLDDIQNQLNIRGESNMNAVYNAPWWLSMASDDLQTFGYNVVCVSLLSQVSDRVSDAHSQQSRSRHPRTQLQLRVASKDLSTGKETTAHFEIQIVEMEATSRLRQRRHSKTLYTTTQGGTSRNKTIGSPSSLPSSNKKKDILKTFAVSWDGMNILETRSSSVNGHSNTNSKTKRTKKHTETNPKDIKRLSKDIVTTGIKRLAPWAIHPKPTNNE